MTTYTIQDLTTGATTTHEVSLSGAQGAHVLTVRHYGRDYWPDRQPDDLWNGQAVWAIRQTHNAEAVAIIFG